MNNGAILEATLGDGEADVEMTVALEFEEGAAPSERPGCAPEPSPGARPALLRTDTLAESLIALFVLAVVQRIVGFGRSVMVCDWLPPAQLGEWDLANRFLVLAAPLVVLGLPGSFGRYLEHYRQRGVLRSVLMRTTLICAALALIAVLGILSAPDFVAEQIFSRADRASNVTLLAVGLVAVIAYNYLTEMLTALRLVRVTSLLEFLNSIGFATLSIVLLALWRIDAFAIVAAYAGSCLLLVLTAGAWLLLRWPHVPRDRAHVPHSEMWRKLVPFAAWVWVTNLLYNAFEVADRYMLLHVGNLPDAQALVGQYHSAQLIPLLMVSAAGLLAGMMLPHLSRDWEAGRPERVSSALNLALKLLGLAMFAGSVLVVLVAPLLFNGVWDGKYADGLALLPLTLVSCSWLGLLTLAQMYLWCAERARLGCISLAIGLATNVALNLVLIPQYGLAGAVTASTISKFVVLSIVFVSNRWLGMQLTRGVCLVVLLPIGVLVGPSIAVVLLIGTGLAVVRTNWLLSEEEKLRVQQVWCNLRLRASEAKPA